MEFFSAGVLLLAVPLNVYVAVVVYRYARERPPIPFLTMLSRIVIVLAALATVLGVLTLNSVVLLITGVRLIPIPITTVALVVALNAPSLVNLLVLRYLRQRRAG